jgi:hypothetical protein
MVLQLVVVVSVTCRLVHAGSLWSSAGHQQATDASHSVINVVVLSRIADADLRT